MASSTWMVLIVSVLAATSLMGVAYAVFGDALTGKSRANRRLSAVSQGKRRGESTSAAADNSQQRRKAIQETLKEIEKEQKEQKKKITLRILIEQAGLEINVRMYWIISGICGLVFGVIGYFVGQGVIGLLLLGFVGFLGVPRWVLIMKKGKREKAFTEEFANSLDVIIRGVKSGLPLNECLKIIATESPEPIGSEFQRLNDGSKMGVPLDQGLQKMYDRISVPELNFFMIVLMIQQSAGGNLSEALNNLSTVLRTRKQMRGKIQALSSEAKASAMIIGSLPPGVAGILWATAPDYMAYIFTTKTGQMMLTGGAIWMTLGILVMKKMINFKF